MTLLPGVRQELRVDQLGHAGVADGRADVGQVGERRQPERRAQRVEPLGADPVELGAGLTDHPELGHERGEPGPPCRRAVRDGERPDRRRQLGEPALLAADAEHLDAVDARRVAPAEQAAPLPGSLGGGLRLAQAPVAQRDRGRILLGHMEREGLAHPPGHVEQRRELDPRGAEVADRDERRDTPLERLGADLDVAQLLGDVAPLRQHVEDVAKRRRTAQPVGAAEHEREPLPVADPAGHGDRLVAHHRALVGPADEGQRPAQSVQHAHTQLGVARIERRPRLLEKLEGALVGDPHPPAGVLVADRGA